MYHCTYGKGCCNCPRHNVLEYRQAFPLKSQEPTQNGPANDAQSQDLVLIYIRSANPMEHEDQCKEPQDGSDENDGRRIY